MPDFPVIIADVSKVNALSFGRQGYWHIAVDDATTVTALGLRIQRHFPIAVDDATTVTLTFHVQRHCPVIVADTSTVLALGFEGFRFPVAVHDTTTVALGFHVQRHFPIAVDDASKVSALGFHINQGRYPVLVHDVTTVTLGFENWYVGMPAKTLLWVGTAGWAATPPGTTFIYNVSRPLTVPPNPPLFRAWKYDASLPYDPRNEINIGLAMYDTMLLAQQACQYDWDQLSPAIPALTNASGGTVLWQQRTRSTNRF